MRGGDVGDVVVGWRRTVGEAERRYPPVMVEGLGLLFVLRGGQERKFSVLTTAGR